MKRNRQNDQGIFASLWDASVDLGWLFLAMVADNHPSDHIIVEYVDDYDSYDEDYDADHYHDINHDGFDHDYDEHHCSDIGDDYFDDHHHGGY